MVADHFDFGYFNAFEYEYELGDCIVSKIQNRPLADLLFGFNDISEPSETYRSSDTSFRLFDHYKFIVVAKYLVHEDHLNEMGLRAAPTSI